VSSSRPVAPSQIIVVTRTPIRKTIRKTIGKVTLLDHILNLLGSSIQPRRQFLSGKNRRERDEREKDEFGQDLGRGENGRDCLLASGGRIWGYG
jgi:hypothetical protein